MSEPAESPLAPSHNDYQVVVVGAGVAGASAAYHLANSGVQDVLVVDAGPDAGQGLEPRYSGSATMPNTVAPCVKMMVQLYAGSTAQFSRHHKPEGCRRYLCATREGLQLQQSIARNVLWKDHPNIEQCTQQLGSFYVAYAQDRKDLREEFDALESLGPDVCPGMIWIDGPQELQNIPGLKGLGFDCAISFPNDAIIDSAKYAKALLRHVVTNNGVTFQPNTRVQSVQEVKSDEQRSGVCRVKLESGETIRAQHVVMATGGLHPLPALNGLLKPCYSYLVHVPTLPNIPASANFFTWGFTHDWCFTNGNVRTSGEDHFSALKPPLCEERCQRLSQWTLEQYGCNNKNDCEIDFSTFHPQYGVYSETPDMVPLVGSLSRREPHISYLVGCNAWGQTILSYCSSLIPGLLGYQPLTEEQRDILKLVSVRRFSHLP